MSLDLFKQLLRAALQAKASVLHIRVDRVPSAESEAGLSDLPCPPVKGQEIMDMINGIAPSETAALLSQGKMRGSLNLGGAGKVNFIGTAANNLPTALLVFFSPDGDKKFDEKWQMLQKAALGAKEPVPVVENALPPEAFAAMANARAKPAKSPDLASIPDPAQNQNNAVHSKGGASTDAPVSQAASTLQEIEYTPFSKGEQTVSAGGNELDRYLKEMVKRKASDIHLTGGEPVCFRADGEIVRVPDTMLTPEYMKQLLEPIIPPRNREEFLKINDTDFAYEVTGVGRFRVNIFRDKNGVGSVMRHIPSTILTAEQLKLTPSITNFCKLNKGLVLVTGPTGSGKSTTLAAMIDLINKNRHDHILTVEDPIEFVHSQQKCLVNQREVHRHTTSFARALKAALREDPDIVLIGEMRDLETISIAIETAETGHLVFGTLHTTTAVSTVDRIIQQFPAERQEQIRMMLAGGLRGVVAQNLLKKIGGGRVAAHEILVVNDAVSAMIREGKNHMIPNHMQTQKADGNQLLNEALMNLVSGNVVSPADAYAKAVDKNNLAEMMKRKGIDTTPFEMKKSA
jgi:twitching motility protein PilT